MPQPVSYFDKLDFIYEQSSGNFYLADGQDVRALIARGYSGKGDFKDAHWAEMRKAEGPIPRGVWRIAPATKHPRLGPIALPLQPFGHDALGRTEFFIHGDNPERNQSASSGCIVLDRDVRLLIDFIRAGKRFGALTVVSGV